MNIVYGSRGRLYPALMDWLARSVKAVVVALFLGASLYCSQTGSSMKTLSETEPKKESVSKVSENYPRIVYNNERFDRANRLISRPGNSDEIRLKDGRRVRASHKGQYLLISIYKRPAPEVSGTSRQISRELKMEAQDMNHSIHAMGGFFLVVSGVNAGPAGTGTLINANTGKAMKLEVEHKFEGMAESERGVMSLYSMCILEVREDVFAVAGTANQSILLLDLSGDRPDIEEIAFPEIAVEAELRTVLRGGQVFFRYRDDYTAGAPWKEFKGPAGIQP